MSTINALILGVVQGLAEFFPVSSSAHLLVVPALLGWDRHPLAFDIMLHFGTFFAIAVYFRKDWMHIFRSHEGRRLLRCIIAGTIPAALVGIIAVRGAEAYFRSPLVAAFCLAFFGLLLFAADKYGRKDMDLSAMDLKKALLIGAFQVLAFIPGVSRSGITISAGLALGMDRKDAARFSFLLAAPLIFAAAFYGVGSYAAHTSLVPLQTMLWGFTAAFISSIAAIHIIYKYVRRHSFTPFVIYRLVLALVIVAALSRCG